MEKIITVFTPTYNRKETLEICYHSLLQQKNKAFIWQIIDDGSTDGTNELVKSWESQKLIDIVYIEKENGGKASAINLSLEKCKTPLWMCLDSDDYLTKDSIEIILNNYYLIKEDDKLCGMFALRSNMDLTPMQHVNIPKELKRSTQNYIRYELNIPPEYVHIYKTDIIKRYPYPIIKGENYIPLSYVFDQIDLKYEYLVLHNPIMICEYKSDGITNNKRRLIRKNPIGYMLYKKQLIKYAPNFTTRVKACITYNSACLLSGEILGMFKSTHKLLTLMSFPFGLADYILRYRLEIPLNIERIKKM